MIGSAPDASGRITDPEPMGADHYQLLHRPASYEKASVLKPFGELISSSPGSPQTSMVQLYAELRDLVNFGFADHH
jgi:hypothetical protein